MTDLLAFTSIYASFHVLDICFYVLLLFECMYGLKTVAVVVCISAAVAFIMAAGDSVAVRLRSFSQSCRRSQYTTKQTER